MLRQKSILCFNATYGCVVLCHSFPKQGVKERARALAGWTHWTGCWKDQVDPFQEDILQAASNHPVALARCAA